MSESPKEISLRDIFRLAIRDWRIILASAACAFVFACVYAVLATPIYTATVVVQPKTRSSLGGSLGQLAGQLGSISSLAGLNLEGGTSRERNYMAVLESHELALKFINKFDLMPKLFPKQWNSILHRWNGGDPSLLSSLRIRVSREIARISGDQGWHPPATQPTAWQALTLFNRILEIKSERDTGMVRVSFRLRDPEEAAIWANEYVDLANRQIRDTAIREANLALEYLDEQARNTSVTELQTAIYSLMQERLEQIVSAKARPDYAFRVIDRAMVPETRSSPKRLLIVVLMTLIGGAGGLLFVLIREFGGLSSQFTELE